MNCGQQINPSEKSEMNTSSLTKEQMRKYAVETNQPHLFQTTSGTGGDSARTMTEIMKTNKGQVSIWEWRFAEEYDSRMWYEAREKYLQEKVWALEAQMKFLDCDGKPCDRCNEPVCYEGNEGKISERDEAIICSECYARESDEDKEVEEECCEECGRSEKECVDAGMEFATGCLSDYGNRTLCPDCIPEENPASSDDEEEDEE